MFTELPGPWKVDEEIWKRELYLRGRRYEGSGPARRPERTNKFENGSEEMHYRLAATRNSLPIIYFEKCPGDGNLCRE